jgi:hypothetical protein
MPIRSAAERSCVRSSLRSRNSTDVWTLIRKTSLSSDRSDSTAVKQCRQSAIRSRRAQLSLCASRSDLSARSSASFATFVTAMLGAILPLHDVRYHACYGLTDGAMRKCFSFNGRTGIPAGGARRDRTDDLLLAKQALSQLSYGPGAAQIKAAHRFAGCRWWAWEDLNFRPHAYQARALTN